MLLPLLVGDQRRLVLLLLSLPQQPLLVRLDAPTCASTGVYKINLNFNWLKMELILPKPHANKDFIQCLAVQRMLVLLSYRIGSPSLTLTFSNSNRADPSERRQNELDRRKKIEIVKLCTNLMECIYEEPWHFWVVTEEVENSNSQGILSHWVWGGLVDSMAVRQGKGQAVQEYPH